MERNYDYNYNCPPPNFYGFDQMGGNTKDNSYEEFMFNPINQYEQAYMYYRFLAMQLEYKIKCKEYERLYGVENQKKG